MGAIGHEDGPPRFENSAIWFAIMFLAIGLFGWGASMLLLPGIEERWFEPRLPAAVNWILWLAMLGVSLGFFWLFSRRIWWQLSLRISAVSISQWSVPGRRKYLRWADVVKVQRPGLGNMVIIESPGTIIRLTQDAYQDPDQLYRFLARQIPPQADGYQRLHAPTP